ncbi:hypothetical protein ACIQVO_26725 [Streptomyces sp. NPDC101062]|uniref:hypothetical protein n=1 Tax=unclassified Streptomyces TaxID=2593676 RepID=UPI002E75A2CA|nr:hypothetical protein [Streptomyces sp. JV176]MEE1800500.1 hypothetical protein [Streptomyces sp. JV176]
MGMNLALSGASEFTRVLAQAGSTAERLWLLGGMAFALTGAGVVALAAARGRRD